jgi:hypothetical protein
MMDNLDPKNELIHSGVLTYLGVLGISLWGGIVSYFEKKEKFSWYNLIAHLSSASFAGMMTFFGCEYAGVSGPLVGVLCGVAAHMGTPALIALAMKLKIVRNVIDDKEDK